MAAKGCHIGNNINVGYDFPCPKCGKGKASGNFNKAGKVDDVIYDITASCSNPKCGKVYDGTAIINGAGTNVVVYFTYADIKDSQLNVWGY